MKRSFKILVSALLLTCAGGCGIFKKSCNCPKVSGLKPAARVGTEGGPRLAFSERV